MSMFNHPFRQTTQRFITSLAAAGILGAVGTLNAHAAATTADIVIVMDESGSMAGEQAWVRTVLLPALDAELIAAGVGASTANQYALIGFGSSAAPGGRVVSPFTSLANAVTAATGFVTSGATEDGYAGINFGLNNLNFRSGSAVNFILVTDEDRDTLSGAPNAAEIEAALERRLALLNVVVNNPFITASNQAALGVDSDGFAYQADGSGGFISSPGGIVGNGAGNTETAYVQLAFDVGTGGAGWNLNILRNGGNDAISFTEAFVSIKVQEIITQPVIPEASTYLAMVPLVFAGGWLIQRRRARA